MKWGVALFIGAGIIVLGWRLAGLALVFLVVADIFRANCLVLIIVVLLQSGKAADLAGSFGGAAARRLFGPRGAANVSPKPPPVCVMFMLCAFAMVLRTDKAVGQGSSILDEFRNPLQSRPATAPAAPADTPAQPLQLRLP